MSVLTQAIRRLSDGEIRFCRAANRLSRRDGWLTFFAVVSRLGDGAFWYMLMLGMVVLGGTPGLEAALHMALIGIVSLLLYKALKRYSRRPRPLALHRDLLIPVAPLDEFSFPSGHTLHAVSFTVVAVAHFPWLMWVLLPFALAVAASRVVLGLHYPSDVIAAVAIGLALGFSSLALF